MKKVIVFILILFISGCTVVRIDTTDIDNIINVILSKDNSLYNRVGKGYKYYVPRGVSYIDTDDLNDKLYSNGTYYYLYIDAISYYNNMAVEYKEREDAYYSRKIYPSDGFRHAGYLEIREKDNLYYIEFSYNYAKIEALVSEENLNDAVLNAAYILSTIQFNSDVIKIMLDEEYFVSREEKYDKFSRNESGGNNFELQVQE